MELAHKAVQTHPTSDHAWLIYAAGLQEQGQRSEAIDAYLHSLSLYRTVYAHTKLAELYQQDQPDQAIAQFEAALKLNPELAQTHTALGRLKMQTGKDARSAEQHFQTAIQIDPHEYWAYNNLAVLYASQGNLPAARRVLTECLRRNPQFEPALATARAIGMIP